MHTLTTRPATNDAHYLESGIGMRWQMGILGGHCGFIVSLHSGGTHEPEDVVDHKYKGG